MLTLEYVMKIARMNEQYGPPEDSFSPDYHLHPKEGPEAPVLRETRHALSHALEAKAAAQEDGIVVDPTTTNLHPPQSEAAPF